MNIKAGHISIATLSDLSNRDKLIIPSYQRQYCWNDAKIELLIDSISKGIPIGVFQFRELSNGSLEVVDGLHRIRTLFNILNGKGVYFDTEKQQLTLNAKHFDYSQLVCNGRISSVKAWRLGMIGLEVIELLDTLDTALERFKTIELLHFTFSGTDSEIQTAFDRTNEKGVAFTPVFKPVKKNELLKF